MKRYSILFILFAIATVNAFAAIDCGTANEAETTWPVALHKYANNATLVCKVLMGETPVENADVGVFAKADEECRGGVVTNSKGYAWMMIYGDTSSEVMYFKVKVGSMTYNVKQTYTYIIDDSKGTNADPVIIHLDNVADALQVAPSVISSDDKSKDVDVYLFNPMGQYSDVTFNLTLPTGISVSAASLADRTASKNFTPLVKKNADGSYAISLSSTDNTAISGLQGNVMRLTLSADATAVAGLGEFKMSDIALSTVNGIVSSADEYKATLFYGKSADMPSSSVSLVGNLALGGAQDAFSAVMAERKDISVIDVTGAINLDATKTLHTGNGNTLVYVAKGMTIGNVDNVVVDNNCANFVIHDNDALTITKALHADNVSYTRTGLRANGMYTLALPFSGAIPEGCKLYSYDYVDDEKMMVHFDETATLSADLPYIIRSGGSSFTVSATNVDLGVTPSSVSDDEFICTYQGIEAGNLTGCYALHSDGSGFGICDATAYATPFHGYIQVKSASDAKFYRLFIDGEGRVETGVDTINAYSDDLQGGKDLSKLIYNLNGQRTNSLMRGINIVNGKKVMKY